MKSKGPAGFSLVEVALALGLIVFCLLTLMALLPVGVKSNRESIRQTAAASFAAAAGVPQVVASQLRFSQRIYPLEK